MTNMYLYDDVTVSLIPSNAGAVAGYVNGIYANLTALRSKFPNAHILDIAVTASADATCLDIETGDATNAQAPAWFKRQKARGVARPVLYTSAGNSQALINTMANNGVARSAYLLWSAHYTNSAHICAKTGCGYPNADGTQFTSRALGKSLDESLVSDAFFGANTPVKPPSVTQPTPPNPPSGEARVPDCRGMSAGSAHNQLLRAGLNPQAESGQTASEVCWETEPAHWSFVPLGGKVTIKAGKTTPTLTMGSTETPWNLALQEALVRAGISIKVDGVYGANTDEAVRYFQFEKFGIAGSDGVVGPQTWKALTDAGTVTPPAPVTPPPAPKPVAYPAPGNFKVSPWIKHDVSWSASVLNGVPASSYTLQVLDANGKQFAETTVKGTSYTISVPKGSYELRVWPNGGSVAPQHASVKIVTE